MWPLFHPQTTGSHPYTKPHQNLHISPSLNHNQRKKRKTPNSSQRKKPSIPNCFNKAAEGKNKNQACFRMTTSISATGFTSSSTFRGSWGSSVCGEDGSVLIRSVAPNMVRVGKPMRLRIVMGNVNEGKGIFAPAVVVVRNIVGKKRFNQLRGKAIALHSQVITEFCKSIGADAKQRQGLIRLAKKNGEKLGFLA